MIKSGLDMVSKWSKIDSKTDEYWSNFGSKMVHNGLCFENSVKMVSVLKSSVKMVFQKMVLLDHPVQHSIA